MRRMIEVHAATIDALYSAAMDAIETMEVAASELGFGVDYVIERFYRGTQ